MVLQIMLNPGWIAYATFWIVNKAHQRITVGVMFVARSINDQFFAQISCFHRRSALFYFNNDALVFQKEIDASRAAGIAWRPLFRTNVIEMQAE